MKTPCTVLAAAILALLVCKEIRSRTDPQRPAPSVAGQWHGLLSSLPNGSHAELVNIVFTQNGRSVSGGFSTLSLGDVMIEGHIDGPDLYATATSVSPSGTYRGPARGPASAAQIELHLSALTSSDGTPIHDGDSVLQLTR
jgi:hypothetical protein